MVSVPERSKGVDSSSTVFALVGSNPTADTPTPVADLSARRLLVALARAFFTFFFLSRFSHLSRPHTPPTQPLHEMHDTGFTSLLHAFTITEPSLGSVSLTALTQDCSR